MVAGTRKTQDMSPKLVVTVIAIATITTVLLAIWAVYVARATAEEPDPALAASVRNVAASARPGVEIGEITHHGSWPSCATATVEYADGGDAKIVSVYENGWKSARTDAPSVGLRQVKTEDRCLVMARTGSLPGE